MGLVIELPHKLGPRSIAHLHSHTLTTSATQASLPHTTSAIANMQDRNTHFVALHYAKFSNYARTHLESCPLDRSPFCECDLLIFADAMVSTTVLVCWRRVV